MKVLNLCCAHGHLFEGWFGSEDDFLTQNGSGQIECPMCADRVIQRRPSAPRLNLSHARGEAAAPTDHGSDSSPATPTTTNVVQAAEGDMQAMWLKAVQHVMANTEDVGPRFAEEARRIHYGEVEARGIRGQATMDERAALADEGIEAMALPMPAALKGAAH